MATAQGSAPDRWLAVGRSDAVDARSAGAEATREALQGSDPKLLIVFCSDAYHLGELLAGVGKRGKGVPTIGCTTGGEIATSGPGDAGVVVTALGGSGFSVATATGTDASTRLRAAGAEAAECISAIGDPPYRVLILLTDGLAGDQTEIVRGAYAVSGAAVPLVGGSAGDDMKMSATFQIHGDEVLTDSVVAAALGSSSPIGIGVRHGWRPVGEPILVTESVGNHVVRLDDRPALDVYLELLRPPELVASDPAEFTRFAQTHPLGIVARHSETRVRFIGGADFERRSLSCIAAVPQGGLAWLMEGDAQSVLEATDAACEDALAALEGHNPLGMIAFDCIARRGVLGDEGIKTEIDRIAAHVDGAPVSGFYTYGEIARTHGVTGFHNQTLVVLAVS